MKHPSDEPLQVDDAGENLDASLEVPRDDASSEITRRKDWQVWPPSPKVQIVLIAMAFGVFNLILLAIWALVMVYRF